MEKKEAIEQLKELRYIDGGTCNEALQMAIDALESEERWMQVAQQNQCTHNFIQKDSFWKSCTHCGMLYPLLTPQ